MATLRCPVHGPQEDHGQKFCKCMEFLVRTPDPVTLPDEPESCGVDDCGTPLVDGQCPVHSLGRARSARKTTRDPLDVDAVTLTFPWGPAVVDTELRIGRAVDLHELAALEDEYSNVSREHAVVRRTGSVVVVVDHDSLNGTFVNGREIRKDDPTPLRDGDVLRFGATLSATVHIGRS